MHSKLLCTKQIPIVGVALSCCLLICFCNNAGTTNVKTDTSGVAKADTSKLKLRSNPCAFIYLPEFFFPSDQQPADTVISAIVETILYQTGMHLNNKNRNFYLTMSNVVQNAVALSQPIITDDSILLVHRFIICAPSFIKNIQNRCSRAAVYVLLAHEIAHHLNGDNFSDSDVPEERTQQELMADSFAGYLCYELGVTRNFTLDSCTILYQVFGDSLDTKTHPKKETRIDAFTNGWQTAKGYSTLSCAALNAIEKDPQTAIQEFSSNNTQYLSTMRSHYMSAIAKQPAATISAIQNEARNIHTDTAVVNLRGDAAPIVRNQNDSLMNSSGETFKSARLRPLAEIANPTTSISDYLIDKKHIIWARYPNGVPYIAGFVRKK